MKTLKPVFANKGVEKDYKRKLDKLVDAMSASVMYWILADYENRSATEMAFAIQKRVKQWKKVFGEKADEMALWFAQKLKKHAEVGMNNSFKSAGLKMRKGISKNVQKAVEIENSSLIESIPEKYFTGVETVAMLALLYGWSKDEFKESLEKRYEVCKRRVKTIARDQTHKTNYIFTSDLCKENGIRYAKWVYTYRSEVPRESHIQADGQVFDIDKGCLIDGEFIFPAQKINCQCSFRPVVEELGDDMAKEIEKNAYYKKIAEGVK